VAAATFDALEFVEALRESGMTEAQARAISRAVRGAHEAADLTRNRDLRKEGRHRDPYQDAGHAG
jgi:hypothetical protein